MSKLQRDSSILNPSYLLYYDLNLLIFVKVWNNQCPQAGGLPKPTFKFTFSQRQTIFCSNHNVNRFANHKFMIQDPAWNNVCHI